MKKESIVLIVLLIILSNCITARVISRVTYENTVTNLTFQSNTIIVDEDRYIIIDNETRGSSNYKNRGPFRSPTPFVKDMDVVPTAESAVRIADIISSAMDCNRYGEFNPFEHDAEVRFFADENLWEVFYNTSKLNRNGAIIAAKGHNTRGLGSGFAIGPSFIINKTTGEILILHEGFA